MNRGVNEKVIEKMNQVHGVLFWHRLIRIGGKLIPQVYI